MSTVQLTTVLKRVDTIRNAWLRLRSAAPDGRDLGLLFDVSAGRRGRIVLSIRVRCVRVQEWQLDDLDGGGMRLYGSDHPLA